MFRLHHQSIFRVINRFIQAPNTIFMPFIHHKKTHTKVYFPPRLVKALSSVPLLPPYFLSVDGKVMCEPTS